MDSEAQSLATFVNERAHAADIDASPSLSPRHYFEADLFEREKEAVYYRSWQFAGHRSQLTRPGDYVTRRILDQEVFLICGDDGEVRAFYNACAHRAHPLLADEGHCKGLVCPYHAWRYSLDGQLKFARGLDAPARRSVALTPVRIDWLADFVFINLDAAADPIAAVAPGFESDLRHEAPFVERLKPAPASSKMFPVLNSNWKVIVDNYLECYHCGNAHPEFAQVFDVPNTEISLMGRAAKQRVPRHNSSPVADYPLDDNDAVRDGIFWFLYPNTGIGLFPGSETLSISYVEPLDAERSTRAFRIFSPSGELTEQEQIRREWLRRTVSSEDVTLCEAVHRGLKQRGYAQGRYVASGFDADEKALHAFHRFYLTDMHTPL